MKNHIALDHFRLEDESAHVNRRPLLIVVEGQHDIEFLGRISRILHTQDPSMPDLRVWEKQHRVLFIPSGGGDFRPWLTRLSILGCPEFHLYDRETLPATLIRQQWVDAVNRRQGCRAVLTNKRSLENYLHPFALFLSRGVHVNFGDFDDVAETVAHEHLRTRNAPCWDQLSRRARRRLRDRQKRWLNCEAVEHMTAELLSESDPQNEVRSWLQLIADLGQPHY